MGQVAGHTVHCPLDSSHPRRTWLAKTVLASCAVLGEPPSQSVQVAQPDSGSRVTSRHDQYVALRLLRSLQIVEVDRDGHVFFRWLRGALGPHRET